MSATVYMLFYGETWGEAVSLNEELGPYPDRDTAMRAAEEMSRVPLEWERSLEFDDATAYTRGWMYRVYPAYGTGDAR